MRYRQCTLAIRLSADSVLLCTGKMLPPCPGLSTLGQTPCSWEISLIEGCQLCDAQMQIRGSRHPVENTTDFHPVEVFDILKGLWHCFRFSSCIPCFASASPSLPPPISTFFALPEQFQLAQKEWAPCNSRSQSCSVRLPTELHGCAGARSCPGKELCRQRATSPHSPAHGTPQPSPRANF